MVEAFFKVGREESRVYSELEYFLYSLEGIMNSFFFLH